MGTDGSYPVHSSVTVQEAVDIYHHNEWWKAAVLHTTGSRDSTAVAIYLWHNDGSEWTRKAKYNIKTLDAWKMDAHLVESYLETPLKDMSDPPELPVSDYYSVAGGETVFKTDSWWKGIAVIDEKGGWETQEVIIYLWQLSSGDWRRRQKYTIKSKSDWEEDYQAVNELFGETSESELTESGGSSTSVSSTEIDLSDSPVLDIAEELGIECESPADLDSELEHIHLATMADD